MQNGEDFQCFNGRFEALTYFAVDTNGRVGPQQAKSGKAGSETNTGRRLKKAGGDWRLILKESLQIPNGYRLTVA